jgi:hypothetical protein
VFLRDLSLCKKLYVKVFLIQIELNFFWQDIGEKLSEIGGRLDYPHLTKDLAKEIETLWEDAAIQVTDCKLIALP